jgi:hypothetical protein
MLKSDDLQVQWSVAYVWEKPMFVLLRGVTRRDLPSYLQSAPAFQAADVTALAKAVKESQLTLSSAERRWVHNWYKAKRVPIKFIIKQSELLSELETKFAEKWGRSVRPERLLGGLNRSMRPRSASTARGR